MLTVIHCAFVIKIVIRYFTDEIITKKQMLIMSVTWVQLVCLSVFILFHYFRLPKVTDEDIVQLQQAKGTPLQYIVSPDRPTVDSPFEKVQLGSILSYQVQIFDMVKPMQQRDYNVHQSSLQFSVSSQIT